MEYEFRPSRIEGIRNAITDPEMRQTFRNVVDCYHVKDEVEHRDGSMGSIRISPYQLLDLIAYITLATTASLRDATEQDMGTDRDNVQ